MLKDLAIILDAANTISDAASTALDAYTNGLVHDEEAITGVMIGAILNSMQGYKTKGVTWDATVLRAKGPATEEKKYGADFMGVLDINITGFKVQKGFLMQAKKLEPGDPFSRSDWSSLQSQCHKMLHITPDSFVLIYSTKEFKVVPAISIIGGSIRNPHSFYSNSIRIFYLEHFKSFIGDGKLWRSSNVELQKLADAKDIASVVRLTADDNERRD